MRNSIAKKIIDLVPDSAVPPEYLNRENVKIKRLKKQAWKKLNTLQRAKLSKALRAA